MKQGEIHLCKHLQPVTQPYFWKTCPLLHWAPHMDEHTYFTHIHTGTHTQVSNNELCTHVYMFDSLETIKLFMVNDGWLCMYIHMMCLSYHFKYTIVQILCFHYNSCILILLLQCTEKLNVNQPSYGYKMCRSTKSLREAHNCSNGRHRGFANGTCS